MLPRTSPEATVNAVAREMPGELVRCTDQPLSVPHALWHRHAAFELHLVEGASGLAFIGDWIGVFEPGHVVLTGPHLLHGWLPLGEPAGGSQSMRHHVIRFSDAPLADAARGINELGELGPLFERARHGIEFHGVAPRLPWHRERIEHRQGVLRLGAFCDLLGELAASSDHRTLSSVPAREVPDGELLGRLGAVVLAQVGGVPHVASAARCAAALGVGESAFSRVFQRHTGRTYTDFMTRLRVQRAGHALRNSNRTVSQIAQEVGYANASSLQRHFVDLMAVTPREYRNAASCTASKLT